MLCVKRLNQGPARFYKRQYRQHVTTASSIAKLNAESGREPKRPASSVTAHNGPLQGKSVAVKDNIVTNDRATAAASLTLERYQSPFDATVVKLLRETGARIVGGLNMDEFGMGSHSQSSYFGAVKSPYTRGGIRLSPGGSSGGSAIAVASGEYWAALGTDTGGSVRLPAAYTGVTGFKPSYGLLSRWGVIQYANSLDTVGILARQTSNIRVIFAALNHFDALDPTSLSTSVRARFASTPTRNPRSIRIGIPMEYNIAELAPRVKQTYISLLRTLQSAGHTIHPVSLPSTRLALSAYYILAPAEASSNLAKYDGVRYGFSGPTPVPKPDAGSGSDAPPSPLYADTRGASFGSEVQRRILLGAYSLSAAAKDNYFLQAQRVRRLVRRDFDAVFARGNPLIDAVEGEKGEEGRVDVLLTPTAPTLPPTVEEVGRQTPVESYMNDVFTVPASLAGLPAVSVPVRLGEEVRGEMEETDVGMVGMQVIGQFGDDELVLDFSEMLEGLRS